MLPLLIFVVAAFWISVFLVFFWASDTRPSFGEKWSDPPAPLGEWVRRSGTRADGLVLETRYLAPERGFAREWIVQTRTRDPESGRIVETFAETRVARARVPR